MSQYSSPNPQGLQALSLIGTQHEVAVPVTAAQIRTLNTVPVDILPAPGATRFYCPLYVIYLFAPAATPVAFSGSVAASLFTPANFGTAIGTGILFDGTVSEGGVDDENTMGWSGNVGGRQFITSASPNILNQPLQLKSGANRTAGAGTLTVILTYALYDADGLI